MGSEMCIRDRVTTEQIKGTGRARDIVVPRQIAMYLIREMTSHSLPEIGQYFGRDHSTVMHAINKVSENIKKDEEMAAQVSRLRQHLEGLHDAEGEAEY